MKIVLMFILVIFFFVLIIVQNILIDFEENGNGVDWIWIIFENGENLLVFEIIFNLDFLGINIFLIVVKFIVLQEGQFFVGCEIMYGVGIGIFNIEEFNLIIWIMVWKFVISDVGIKLVIEMGWFKGEFKVVNIKVNEWE